ncbi:hypothetical protein D6D22_03363 [Aureobasidium pullulans]|uniref:Uncharacterized protein n=1 Tax=Aureobasidium pullulans TaxID=5580 RepID=A0A4S8Y375_AURPU|nr:hypothetical protein D6D22_03363 [Aureobasidium pullulans]
MSTENVEMDNRSRIFCDLFMKANDYFDNNEFEESRRIFSLLLDYADLSDYHRAGCHRILSLGEDNFLWHAERAVDLYENLFVVRPGSSYTGEFPPTEKAIRAQNILLGLAKESLESARKDTAEIKADYEAQHRAFLTNHGRKPTDEELVLAHHRRYNQHQLDSNAEFEEKYQKCLQAGNEEEGDDEDDEVEEDEDEDDEVEEDEDEDDEDEGDADKGDSKEPKDNEESHDSDLDVGERLLDLPYDSPTPDASSQAQQSSAANPPNKPSNLQRELMAWESEAGDG